MTVIDSSATKMGGSMTKGDRSIANDFAIGLHFGMIKYMDFSFQVNTHYESVSEYKSGKYQDAEKATVVSLPLSLAFKKDMLSLGITYEPEIMTKDNDGKAGEAFNHTLAVTLGVRL